MRKSRSFWSAVRRSAVLCVFTLLAAVAGCNEGSQSVLSPEANTENPPGEPVKASTEPNSQGSPELVSTSQTTTTKSHQPADNTPKPLLEGWKKPAIAVVLSAGQHGYFEPCGCTERQSGGLSRRADLFRQIRERGWPVTGLDLGGIPNSKRTIQEQSRLKFESMLNALSDMKYEVTGFGPEEIRFGWERLLTLQNFSPDAENVRPSFVSANVQILDGSFGPRRYKIIKLDGAKIGVTSILGKSKEKEAFPGGPNEDVALKDPAAVLPEVIAELKKQKPDLMVLLSHASRDESRALGEQFREFDLILSAGGPEDGLSLAELIGESMMVNVGRKGKHVGVVGFYPDDAKNRWRYELVELDQDRFADTPKIQAHMRAYQQMLKDNYDLVMDSLTRGGPHISGAKFVGAEKCGECHTRAFKKWKSTPHAHAYESIVRGRSGIPRTHDPECISCHVTGWNPQGVFRYESGFEIKERAGDKPELFTLLQGNQCENCHGPGSKHIELMNAGEEEAARKQTKITLDFAKKQLCYRCHDNDNDPHFNSEVFDEYWEKIKHPWTD